MFDNFPYTDMHQLNLDWIIKIAKDFLDQYTHIQELITNGIESIDETTENNLQELNDKYTELEGLLNAWYTTHSNDIAAALAAAVQSFSTQAAAIGANVVESIPEEYTELSTSVTKHTQFFEAIGKNTLTWNDGVKINTSGVGASDANYSFCSYVAVPPKMGVYIKTFFDETASCVVYNANHEQMTILTNPTPFDDKLREIILAPSTSLRYVRTSCLTANKANAFIATYPTKEYILSLYDDVGKAVSENAARNGLSDMDDSVANRVYTLTDRTIANLPPSYNNIPEGSVITFNGDSNFANGQTQFYVTSENYPFVRIKWDGTWSGWMDMSTYGIESEFSGIDMFDTFAVVGDSYANGWVCTSDHPQGITVNNCKWPKIIEKHTGVESFIYGWGGCSTYTFLDSGNQHYNVDGFGKMLNDLQNDPKKFYILTLGINDSNENNTFGGVSGGISYIGSSSDINLSDPTQNTNSFWGNYGRIIQTIKNTNSAIKIALATIHRKPSPATATAYEPFNQAIREIAAFFEIPVIELKKDLFFTSTYWLDRMTGYHPTAAQYPGMAKALMRLISRTISQNYQYFKNYPDA